MEQNISDLGDDLGQLAVPDIFRAGADDLGQLAERAIRST